MIHPDQPASWTLSLALPVALALAAWGLRLVRRSAVTAGAPSGILVLRLGGIGAFCVLLGFFLLGTGLTRIGYGIKAARGVAEEAGGRRGASHVAANCGVGLLLLLLRRVLGLAGHPGAESGLLWVAFLGSFATAASDTSSSEIGQLLGRHPISLKTLRPVPIGTTGAVSREGLAAGLGAAGAIALLGRGFGLVDWPGVLAVTSGGFIGNLLESLAGTWGRRALPHGWLNFANTAVGAGLAAAGARLIGW
jgi:uncharacterized protein (TIGR00297 family)